MENDRFHILATGALDADKINTQLGSTIVLEEIPFIKITASNDLNLPQTINELASKEEYVIFTSSNAVEIVSNHITTSVNWKIWCVGNKTKELTTQKFGSAAIMANAKNALELAEIIIERKVKNIIFFCGGIRRDELPSLLSKNNINVREIVVYHTVLTPVKLKKQYQAILFFSPSSVESFFQLNAVEPGVKLFSIGETTTEALKRFSTNIITSSISGKKEVMDDVIHYVRTLKLSNQKND